MYSGPQVRNDYIVPASFLLFKLFRWTFFLVKRKKRNDGVGSLLENGRLTTTIALVRRWCLFNIQDKSEIVHEIMQSTYSFGWTNWKLVSVPYCRMSELSTVVRFFTSFTYYELNTVSWRMQVIQIWENFTNIKNGIKMTMNCWTQKIKSGNSPEILYKSLSFHYGSLGHENQICVLRFKKWIW